MKKILFAVLALLLVATAHASEPSFPKISMVYGYDFDDWCPTSLKLGVVHLKEVAQLKADLANFEKAWDEVGPELLKTSAEVVGTNYQFHEARATLVLCYFPSLSDPLMVNMRAFVAETAGDSVSSKVAFSGTLFEVVLERYIDDILKARHLDATPLLYKYRNEPSSVRDNLLADAVAKLVYERLGRLKDLKEVEELESHLVSAARLNRAREIEDKEGAENFVRELRK